MNIGLTLSVTERVADIVWIARQAEAMGFESLWVAEHPMIPVRYAHFPNSADDRVPEIYAHWPDPFVSLAAAVTSRIKLATGICLIPERDPIVTAKMVASLDVLSQGRVILGVGGGALREETEIMGTAFGMRWKRLRENVEAMKELWTKDEASYEGEFVRFPPVRSYPKPYQQPHPPVLLGARGPKALARVARYCEGWLPFGISPDEARKAIATISRLASDAGRRLNPPDVTIMAGLDGLSLELLKKYQEAGVNRYVVPLPAIPKELARLAAIVQQTAG
jgi:probable F420-dependent oxidoreductase